jgi:SPP1 gp7 family putative phage head morphogenesis protein
VRSLALDARKAKQKYKPSAAAEREFFRALKDVARHAGHIVDQHAVGAKIRNDAEMMRRLAEYAEKIGPWAERQALKLLESVSKSNKRAYQNQSKKVGRLLSAEVGYSGATAAPVAQANVARVGQALLHEQVALIKSLPIEAGLRAQRIAAENILNGRRAKPDPEIVKQLEEEMGMSTEVAINRARLIARTETARSNASFVQARAVALGVTSYIWRTSGDASVRESHKEMQGKVIQYDKPPLLSDGMKGHAGTFPNCRCWQDPILPDEV